MIFNERALVVYGLLRYMPYGGACNDERRGMMRLLLRSDKLNKKEERICPSLLLIML
ncbi:MAG: hypothetical protein NC218_06985 [Acetobacter sp.]|nr:hypothetical protein [Acetobacter sp.]